MATKAAPKTDAPTTGGTDYAEIGRAFVDFLREERDHRRLPQDQTISFRSEATLRLHSAEARARALGQAVLDSE